MRRRTASTALVALALFGCNGRPLSDAPDEPVAYTRTTLLGERSARTLDVFVVVDTVAPDAELARRGVLAEALARGLADGDVDGDGRREITPVDDVRMMVVPSDPALVRDDALPEFEFRADRGDDAAAFASAVGRAARERFDGASAWPQPLEAALVALTSVCVPPERADVAVVFVTTRDDCSLRDPRRAIGAPGPGCGGLGDDALEPLERYRPLFRGANDAAIAWGLVAGLDAGVLGAGAACVTPAGTPAWPSPRLLQAARSPELWPQPVLASVCSASPALELRDLFRWLGPSDRPPGCVGYLAGIDQANECAVIEAFDADAGYACDDVPGRTGEAVSPARGVSGCVVARVGDADGAAGAGWFGLAHQGPAWECPDGPFVGFTRGLAPRSGAAFELACTSRFAARP